LAPAPAPATLVSECDSRMTTRSTEGSERGLWTLEDVALLELLEAKIAARDRALVAPAPAPAPAPCPSSPPILASSSPPHSSPPSSPLLPLAQLVGVKRRRELPVTSALSDYDDDSDATTIGLEERDKLLDQLLDPPRTATRLARQPNVA
jgi:hypothetical protein